MKVHLYEIAFLIREGEFFLEPTLALIADALQQVGGVVESEDKSMGVRKLAYVIQKNREKFYRAYYYFVKVQIDGKQLPSFEEKIRYDDNIIRHMVVLEK